MPLLRVRLVVLLALLVLTFSGAVAAPRSPEAAVRAVDAERVEAMIRADRERLEEILSGDLHYAHSNGKIDSKTTLIDALVSGRINYERWEYRRQSFLPAGDSAVVMTGQVVIAVRTPEGSQEIDLNVLAVWRREGERWRFLAWQSARHP